MGKLKQNFCRIADRLEIHSEYIRYLWPNASWRFCVCNFITADWLRTDIREIRYELHRAKALLSSLGSLKEEGKIDIDRFCRVLTEIERHLDRADEAAKGVFRV